jgi:hypothetical protein
MKFQTPSALTMRYRQVIGSTVRWAIRLDVDLAVTDSSGRPPQTLDAMVTSQLDCEVLKIEGQTALVRCYAHTSDFWVRGGTLDEDDVADPMAGFVEAFLLDDLGSVVPLANQQATALAPPDDGSAGRWVLLALIPPIPEEEIQKGAAWRVQLHEGTVGAAEPVEIEVELTDLGSGSDGKVEATLTHRTRYGWSRPAHPDDPRQLGVSGVLVMDARSKAGVDGWPRRVDASGSIEVTLSTLDGTTQTIRTRLKLVADRQ